MTPNELPEVPLAGAAPVRSEVQPRGRGQHGSLEVQPRGAASARILRPAPRQYDRGGAAKGRRRYGSSGRRRVSTDRWRCSPGAASARILRPASRQYDRGGAPQGRGQHGSSGQRPASTTAEVHPRGEVSTDPPASAPPVRPRSSPGAASARILRPAPRQHRRRCSQKAASVRILRPAPRHCGGAARARSARILRPAPRQHGSLEVQPRAASVRILRPAPRQYDRGGAAQGRGQHGSPEVQPRGEGSTIARRQDQPCWAVVFARPVHQRRRHQPAVRAFKRSAGDAVAAATTCVEGGIGLCRQTKSRRRGRRCHARINSLK